MICNLLKALFLTFTFITFSMAQNVGINSPTPQSSLDVNGAVKLDINQNTPIAGMIRWNQYNKDFEGYNGEQWISLTRTNASTWGSGIITSTKNDHLLIDSIGSSGDWFGNSVAIDSNFAVIGSHRHNSFQGKIVIFQKIGGCWLQDTIIEGPGGLVYSFGQSVDIYDHNIVVGAPGGQSKSYIYHYDGSQWNLDINGLIDPSQISGIIGLGYDVSIFDNNVLLGAPNSSYGSAPMNSGVALLYTKQNGGWSNSPLVFRNPNSEIDSKFGFAVDMHNNNVIIGEPGKNNKKGIAHIFTFGNGFWTLQDTFSSNALSPDDQYGYSVALHDNVAAIGTPFYEQTPPQIDRGYVALIKKVNSNWTLSTNIFYPTPSDYDNFGLCLDISDKFLAIGGARANLAGPLSIYDISNIALLTSEVLPLGITLPPLRIYSVEIDQNQIIFGTPLANSSKGASYIIDQNN